MADAVPTVEASGASIPALGLGTWMNTGEQCVETVRTALDLGYRHIDTAQVYGNERDVGKGIAAADVDRDEVFLTTKVWRSNLRPDEVHTTVEESLDRLDVEYVDLLLIHWPHPRRSVERTLAAMAELQDRGAVHHLGVANFTTAQLRRVSQYTDRPLVTDQVLYHPLREQSTLRDYCVDHDVALTAYSPLARGAVVDDDLLGEVGEGYGKSAAQVALRWLVQQDGVVAIPKATGPAHLRENLDVFDFELTAGEMNRIHDRSPGLKRWLINRLPGLMRRNPLP